MEVQQRIVRAMSEQAPRDAPWPACLLAGQPSREAFQPTPALQRVVWKARGYSTKLTPRTSAEGAVVDQAVSNLPDKTSRSRS